MTIVLRPVNPIMNPDSFAWAGLLGIKRENSKVLVTKIYPNHGEAYVIIAPQYISPNYIIVEYKLSKKQHGISLG